MKSKSYTYVLIGASHGSFAWIVNNTGVPIDPNAKDTTPTWYFDASVGNNRLELSIWSTMFMLATRIYVRFTGIPSKDKRYGKDICVTPINPSRPVNPLVGEVTWRCLHIAGVGSKPGTIAALRTFVRPTPLLINDHTKYSRPSSFPI